MRRLILVLVLGVFFAFPAFASAQSNVTLESVEVQLWPEYDQPSMLVIVDFLVDPSTPLPVDLTFRIPKDANLIAVAVAAGDGGFLNAEFSGPETAGEWQTFTLPIRQGTHYRYEYYQALTFSGNQRLFSYLWTGDYKVDGFRISVLEPLDTISLSTTPAHVSIQQVEGLRYYDGGVKQLDAGEQFIFTLRYEKTSDALVNPPEQQEIQPVAPLDENTPGRVSLSNTLPYIIGGLGLILIVGGVFYYLQWGRAPSHRSRRRKLSHSESESESPTGFYCPQCGARAKPGDRFCRTCGARLRTQEE